MNIHDLIRLDRTSPKRIAVIGDTMTDLWIEGSTSTCQEHCQKMFQERSVMTPGGAANAARQLHRWCSEAFLISPWRPPAFFTVDESYTAFNQINTDLVLDRGVVLVPQKVRYVEGGRVIFRHDSELQGYGMAAEEMAEARRLALLALRSMKFDAVLVCDYSKGFLDHDTFISIGSLCLGQGIIAVADCKRHPGLYHGMVRQMNAEYASRYASYFRGTTSKVVVTRGGASPCVLTESNTWNFQTWESPCVNHVGAGDCFAAHLTLALAHGASLEDAAAIAHAAGQEYVDHEHSRPPWPHEIRKRLGSKVIMEHEVELLAESLGDNPPVVFTNGVFRIPHAGHAWLMSWAAQQGTSLVVGINDNVSAFRQKPGEYIMPLTERIAMLEAMACVDWIIPYTEDDPCEVLRKLRPGVLVKGHEYIGLDVPGKELVSDVQIAPPGPYEERHCTNLVKEVRGE